MRRSLASVAAVIAALVACGATKGEDAVAGAPARFRPIRAGDEAPVFAARVLDSSATAAPLALAALRGRTVLVNIWATWCTPCRREMPALDALARDYASRGVEVVGVNIDGAGKDAAVRAFLDEHDIGFTILRDEASTVTTRFRTRGVPESFLIDRNGRIVHHWLGGVDTPAARLRPIVDSLVAATGAAERVVANGGR